ncbi:MAG TPA: methyltransferase domain-containing protein [Beijerinckiaceae bacterium]
MRTQSKSTEGPAKARLADLLQERLPDEARFIRAWFENPGVTGAVSPSGRFLARAMARHVDVDATGPVIELGPGTGPVTQALLQRGVAPERLILVEYDPAFCKLLERRFPGVRVVQGDAYDLAATLAGVLDRPASAIVSSLPLLNRPEADRLALISDGFSMLAPDGVFVQFTYGMVSPIPRRAAARALGRFSAQASQPVWLNLPPARVWCYRPQPAPLPMKPGATLIFNIKERTGRVKDEILETCDRLETEFRLARDRMRMDIEGHALRVRTDRHVRPALDLLRRIGDGRRRPR